MMMVVVVVVVVEIMVDVITTAAVVAALRFNPELCVRIAALLLTPTPLRCPTFPYLAHLHTLPAQGPGRRLCKGLCVSSCATCDV